MIVYKPRDLVLQLHRTLNEYLRKKAISNIQEISQGYLQKYKGRLRWVSQKGDPANRRDGALQRSMKKHVRGNSLVLISDIRVADYAIYLEMGKKYRPNMRDLFKNNKTQIGKITHKVVQNLIRGKIREYNRQR